MRFEIYLDSLLLLNFLMNLFLLMRTGLQLHVTVNFFRLCVAAFVGAVSFMTPILISGIWWVKLGVGYGIGFFLLCRIAFPIAEAKAFFRIGGYFLENTFLVGGLYFALRPKSVWGLPLLAFLFYLWEWGRQKRSRKTGLLCLVTLYGEQGPFQVKALIDTGNSLVEPISLRPVCLVEKEIMNRMELQDNVFRPIPYSSVGKSRGILKAYRTKCMLIETEGMKKIVEDIYLAPWTKEDGKDVNDVKMILHPSLLR